MCVRSVLDRASEMAEELIAKLGTMLGPLIGGPTPIQDCYYVKRFNPYRHRLGIVRFHSADAKMTVLHAKGVLYRPECPKALHGIRVYHNLFVQQFNWKL